MNKYDSICLSWEVAYLHQLPSIHLIKLQTGMDGFQWVKEVPFVSSEAPYIESVLIFLQHPYFGYYQFFIIFLREVVVDNFSKNIYGSL